MMSYNVLVFLLHSIDLLTLCFHIWRDFLQSQATWWAEYRCRGWGRWWWWRGGRRGTHRWCPCFRLSLTPNTAGFQVNNMLLKKYIDFLIFLVVCWCSLSSFLVYAIHHIYHAIHHTLVHVRPAESRGPSAIISSGLKKCDLRTHEWTDSLERSIRCFDVRSWIKEDVIFFLVLYLSKCWEKKRLLFLKVLNVSQWVCYLRLCPKNKQIFLTPFLIGIIWPLQYSPAAFLMWLQWYCWKTFHSIGGCFKVELRWLRTSWLPYSTDSYFHDFVFAIGDRYRHRI